MKIPNIFKSLKRSGGGPGPTEPAASPQGGPGLEEHVAEIKELKSRLASARKNTIYLEGVRDTLDKECKRLMEEKADIGKRLELHKNRCELLDREKKEILDSIVSGSRKPQAYDNAPRNYLEKNQLMLSKGRDGDMDSTGNWAIPYADFVTLLLTMFIALYSLASTDIIKYKQVTAAVAGTFDARLRPAAAQATGPREAEKELSKENANAPERIKDEISSTFKDSGLGDNLHVEVKEGAVEVTMRESVTFVEGDSSLLDSSKGILRKLSGVIRDYPGYNVLVEGHTDNKPIRNDKFPSNWELSTSRATNVVRFFVEEEGIDHDRFSASGLAEVRPVAGNSTEEGRAKNRRVVIKLVSR
ncbi:MAG: OmpA family protein [Deltaproteobacteria bacterium]|nr:OmpA family protein [Deltaproteobacteria bacterium]